VTDFGAGTMCLLVLEEPEKAGREMVAHTAVSWSVPPVVDTTNLSVEPGPTCRRERVH